jgi:flotillin-like protein
MIRKISPANGYCLFFPRLRREAELKQEKERNDRELADLKLKHEGERLDQQQDLLRKQKLEAESKLELISLEQKRNAVDVELERSKGQVKADNLEREILAKGAHETKMRQMLLDALPKIVEQASRPIEKIGEIKAIHISGGQGPDGGGSSNLGSLFASASSLPIVRELLKVFSEVEGSDRSEPGKGIR